MDHEPSLDSIIVKVQREKKLRKDGQPRKPYTRKKVEKPVSPKGSPKIVIIKKTRKQKPKVSPKGSEKEVGDNGSPKGSEKEVGDNGSPKGSEKEVGDNGSPKGSEKEVGEKSSPKSIGHEVGEKGSKSIGQEVGEEGSPKSSEKEVVSSPKPRRNEDYATMLEQLATIMQKRGDMIRYRTYKKAQETILGITDNIYEPKDVAGKPGIGPTILEKLKEFTEKGTLSMIEREKANPENIFSDIYGVGPKKAKEIVEKGITTIAQLREKQDEVLNDIQKVGLKYYEDILKPIPRAEIDEYAQIFNEVFNQVKTGDADHYEIVGSYRRGKSTSGDIDVILTSSDAKLFTKWVDALVERNVIVEILSRGKTKCLVIARLGDRAARRVDFLFSGPEEYPFAILYFTGSKGFNAAMRGHALKTGVSLNEHGFSKMVAKKKEEKLDVVMKSERDIFDYLGLVYKEPVERVDSRDVVVSSDILDRTHLGEKENLDTEKPSKSPEKKVKFSSSTIVKPKNKTRRLRVDTPSESIEKIATIIQEDESSNKSKPDLVEFCKRVVGTP